MSSTGDKLMQGPLQEGSLGFWGNLKMIRPAAWTIAIILFLGMPPLFWFFIFPGSDPNEMARMPEIAKLCLPLLMGAFLMTYVLLIGFVYVDAKRRAMRHVMWTLLAIFIPNAIGIILYFLMRDPLPTPCPNCSRLVPRTFSFCPNCGTELMRVCKACRRKLEPGWLNCAYCGTPTGAQAPKTT
ncbi:MAG TPA: zinc ribbon domain-containing protein [Candidatus Acidoferrum sp.]|nr:zinc ribbon domain-containing protein [Candidatus Acidoferrum sp.]